MIIEDLDGPAALALSRQNTPVYDRGERRPRAGERPRARRLRAARRRDDAQAVIVGTGTEVEVALGAADLLAAEGVAARVVSMPSWELFAAQDDDYRDAVLPPGLPSVSVEAGVSMGWERWVDASVAIDRFGASAPGALVLEKLGITAAGRRRTRVRGLLGVMTAGLR